MLMNEKRSELVATMVTKETKQTIREIAAKKGLTMSSFLNVAISQVIESELADTSQTQG